MKKRGHSAKPHIFMQTHTHTTTTTTQARKSPDFCRVVTHAMMLFKGALWRSHIKHTDQSTFKHFYQNAFCVSFKAQTDMSDAVPHLSYNPPSFTGSFTLFKPTVWCTHYCPLQAAQSISLCCVWSSLCWVLVEPVGPAHHSALQRPQWSITP